MITLYPGERTACFIDGSNLSFTASKLRIQIDFKKLFEYLKNQTTLAQAVYFTAVHTEEDGQVRIQPLIDWLSNNGFIVVSRPTKSFTEVDGTTVVKGNLDVEIAVRATLLIGKINHFILFSGDGDFTFLVDTLQRNGIRVTVVSSRKTTPPMIGMELRTQADFVEIDEFTDIHKTNPE